MTEDSWHDFLNLCLKFKKKNDLEKFFHLFLTHEEKQLLKARCLIVKALLNNEKTQRKIAEENCVSIAQITRGSNALKCIDPKLREFLILQFA
ncbi:MAG: trp operon repressor [Parachlamydiales bacterium]|nr:trp operon repressor [Parachlamydiales bacterium]